MMDINVTFMLLFKNSQICWKCFRELDVYVKHNNYVENIEFLIFMQENTNLIKYCLCLYFGGKVYKFVQNVTDIFIFMQHWKNMMKINVVFSFYAITAKYVANVAGI